MSGAPTPATVAFLGSLLRAANRTRYSPFRIREASPMRACVRRGWAGLARSDGWTLRVWITPQGVLALQALEAQGRSAS